ncbi:MAG TPA: phosphatase PAP2 family protein [Streptosporangiaceae bacterium]|nr:phosphatase PAP2 family protein [Streptosporangiaceae bacterium]
MSRLRPAVPQQLLPARFRPAAIAVVCVGAAVTAILGIVFAHHTQGSALDNTVANFLQTNGNFGPGGPGRPGGGGIGVLIRPFGMIGSTEPLILFTVIVVYCCLALRRYRGAVLVAASVLIASGLSELVLKPIIDRTRYGSLSYPSGHATAAFALATAIVVLLARPPKTNMPRSMRVVLAVLTMGTAATIAAGLVEIHYFTDTIGGAGVGIAVTLSAALLMDRFSFLGERAPQAAAAVPAAAESARVP